MDISKEVYRGAKDRLKEEGDALSAIRVFGKSLVGMATSNIEVVVNWLGILEKAVEGDIAELKSKANVYWFNEPDWRGLAECMLYELQNTPLIQDELAKREVRRGGYKLGGELRAVSDLHGEWLYALEDGRLLYKGEVIGVYKNKDEGIKWKAGVDVGKLEPCLCKLGIHTNMVGKEW